jgi:DNA topoisomerase-2
MNCNLIIKELPINKWTRNYKNFIEEMMEKEGDIEDMLEFHKTDSVHFELKIKEDKLKKWYEDNSVIKKFKLSKPFSISNMVLFD